MITTGMLKRQVWMADDDEFDHIVKNSQRVFKLNVQYENYPYTEEFTKGRSLMFLYGTYVLEGKAGAKCSLSDICKRFQEDILQNNAGNFCRQIINCMKARKIMMDGEKVVLAGEYRKSPVFAGYDTFAPAGHV